MSINSHFKNIPRSFKRIRISGIVFAPMPCQSRYSATKSAINALSLSLRSEYWDDNIKISSATPGTTVTAIWGDPKAAPNFAQTPRQSASRILNGVVNNERIIFGSDMDAKYGYSPLGEGLDQKLQEVARERRKGNDGFLPSNFLKA